MLLQKTFKKNSWKYLFFSNKVEKWFVSSVDFPFFHFLKLAHFTNQNSSCQLCHQEKELWTHLLEECSVAKGFFQAMRRKCILLNIPSWQKTKNVCGLVSNFLTRQETSVVSVALLSLWLTVCVEGLKSPQYATEIFEKILRKNKILPQPLRTQTKKGKKKKKKKK